MAGLIVHEWIEAHGGSENVVEAMARTFPDAELRCLWNDAPDRFPDRIVRESWLAKTPLRRSKAAALPFMPATWAGTDVSKHEYVLVSSHLFAHHIGGRSTRRGPRKFVYVHTPARYIWTPELDARGNSLAVRLAAPLLKHVDAARANQGATFAANSAYVRDRIRSTWDQDAAVIYPPVNVSLLQSEVDWRNRLSPEEEAVLSGLPKDFLLGASRFVPYKRLDVVIEAGEAAGVPVVLAGSGPQREELLAKSTTASVPVHIVDRPSDALLYALYQASAAFVFPATEDFGIMPVEAMSLGTPVIVSSEGGASESVMALNGGVVLESFSSRDLEAAIIKSADINMQNAAKHAYDMFSEETFSRRLKTWMSANGELEETTT